MLTANKLKTGFGKDLLFEVTFSGAPIAIINDTRSTFEFAGRTFTIASLGIAPPIKELRSGDTLIATAKGKTFHNYYTLNREGKEWTFKATNLLASKFGLFENETQTGTISSGGYFNKVKNITAELPDELPQEVQLFLLTLFIGVLTAPN